MPFLGDSLPGLWRGEIQKGSIRKVLVTAASHSGTGGPPGTTHCPCGTLLCDTDLCAEDGEAAQAAMQKWILNFGCPYSGEIQPLCIIHNCLGWNLNPGLFDVKADAVSLNFCFSGAGPRSTGRLWKGRGMERGARRGRIRRGPG